MREGTDVLVNAQAGERVVVRRRAPEALELTLELSRPGAGPPAHAHPLQTERFRVRRGALALTVEGRERVLRAGDSAAVAPGEVHRWDAREADTEVELTVEPALRFEQVLERAFGLVDAGAFTEHGIAHPRAVAAFLDEFAGEYRLVGS